MVSLTSRVSSLVMQLAANYSTFCVTAKGEAARVSRMLAKKPSSPGGTGFPVAMLGIAVGVHTSGTVLDEAQAIKNLATKRSQAAMAL